MTSARGAQPGGMTWEAEEGRRKGELRPWCRGSLMKVREPLGSLIQGSVAGGFSCGCLNSSCRGPWREGAASKSQHCSREGSRGLRWREREGGCFTQLGSLSCRAYLLRTNQAMEAPRWGQGGSLWCPRSLLQASPSHLQRDGLLDPVPAQASKYE